ncbi:hypothetical protein UPYG_G00251060 [Umbra pygmaea]|uniref:E3 ubiquitin ligase TRAF3IP2 n=1 Tax=Umbra pygmaea TaxID=75934 RepID=A0ABD0WBW1_UMBPY
MNYFTESRSIPVETDESMTLSTIDLLWPSGNEVKEGSRFTPEVTINGISQVDTEDSWGIPMKDPLGKLPQQPRIPSLPGPFQNDFSRHTSDHPMNDYHLHDPRLHLQDFHRPLSWPQQPDCSLEGAENLEAPLPLVSDFHYAPPGHPAHTNPQCPDPVRYICPRQHPCQQPMPQTRPFHNHDYNHLQHVEPQQKPHQHPQPWSPQTKNRIHGQGALKSPCLNHLQAPPRQVMSEVNVVPSFPATTSHQPAAGIATQEIIRTINLPEECRKVFITYSVDVASEMFTFVKFLTDQGFKTAIDIFETAVLSIDVNKWMDSYLKDKSVLIVVVISPKYKADVEGDADDEHGLHTKYIYTQMQNEFIQQRCLNFRLVPVLFPTATKRHVPTWLQSTRIYRWPQDTQDLLLRLLREERFIAPPLGKGLTISIRPI